MYAITIEATAPYPVCIPAAAFFVLTPEKYLAPPLTFLIQRPCAIAAALQ